MPAQSAPRAKATKPPKVTVTLSADKVTLQYNHEARDPWKVLNQALYSLVRIAQCDDAYVAMQASEFLVNYAVNEIDRRERHKASQPDRPSRILEQPGSSQRAPLVNREAVLSELRGLYAKALGPSQLIVEAEPEKS